METIFIGKNCIEVDKTDSTNSYLSRLLTSTSEQLLKEKVTALFEGTVVITKKQERGRGQRGAAWESEPDKNLTLSILLQPTFLRPEEQFQLNKAVALGVMEFVACVLSPFQGNARIKWPNDIYLGNKKVAGILIENSVSGSSLQQSIIGIGINVNQDKFSSNLPNPTSLKLISGQEFDLDECLAQLYSCIERRYLELRASHFSQIDLDYLENLYRFGETASYKDKRDQGSNQSFKAKIIGVAKIGKLILETEKGKILECDFKEVEFC